MHLGMHIAIRLSGSLCWTLCMQLMTGPATLWHGSLSIPSAMGTLWWLYLLTIALELFGDILITIVLSAEGCAVWVHVRV